MSKRHSDALAIATGVCNPSGIAASIVEACREVRAETDYRHRGTIAITSDPAVRLMVYQLAFICGADAGMDAIGIYHDLIKACERRVEDAATCPPNAGAAYPFNRRKW